MRTGKISIGLLKAQDVALRMTLGLQEPDLLSDILESREHVDSSHPVLGCNALRHVGCDYGLDEHRVGRHLVVCLAL